MGKGKSDLSWYLCLLANQSNVESNDLTSFFLGCRSKISAENFKSFSRSLKLSKFEAKGREFAKFLRQLEQFIQTVKVQNNFLKQNAFLTCSWRFFRTNKLEKFEFKLEKIIGFRIVQEKLEKTIQDMG